MNFEMDFVQFQSIKKVDVLINSWIQEREKLFANCKDGMFLIEVSMLQMYRQFAYTTYTFNDKRYTIFPSIYAIAETQLFAESEKKVKKLNLFYGKMIDEVLKKCG